MNVARSRGSLTENEERKKGETNVGSRNEAGTRLTLDRSLPRGHPKSQITTQFFYPVRIVCFRATIYTPSFPSVLLSAADR